MNKMMLTILSMGSLIMFGGTSEAGQGWGKDGAQAPGAMQRHFRGRGHGGLLRGDPAVLKARLGLSDAQVQQVKAIGDTLRARTKAQRDQLRPLRQKMRALMQADAIDVGAIYAVRSQIHAIQQVLNDEGFRARVQMLQVLTKEQREKMKQFRGGRMHHGRGKGHGFGRGRFGGPAADGAGSEV